MYVELEHIIQICAAFTAGGILGLEREYHSKPAGFRTIILITVGSCLFTILSVSFINNPDRIASNIITGIGFLGAGVVFKEGALVRGITSAATIWIAAAMGMCIGLQYYALAALVLVLVLATLVILSKIEFWIDNLRQEKEYVIKLNANSYSIEQLEEELRKMKLHFIRYKFTRNQNEVSVFYVIETEKEIHLTLNNFLLHNTNIISFDLY